MAKYSCTNCGFQKEFVKVPKLCPFCGREGTLKKMQSAEEIVEESD